MLDAASFNALTASAESTCTRNRAAFESGEVAVARTMPSSLETSRYLPEAARMDTTETVEPNSNEGAGSARKCCQRCTTATMPKDPSNDAMMNRAYMTWGSARVLSRVRSDEGGL